MGLVLEGLVGCLLDRSVHALDLAVGPRMPGLGQSMVDVVLGAGILERVRPDRLTVFDRNFNPRGGQTGISGGGEVGAVVGQHNVNRVRNRFDQRPDEVPGDPTCGFLMQLDEGLLRGPIDANRQIELARFAAGKCRDVADSGAVTSGSGSGWLKGIQAVIERQQRVLSKCNDDGFVLDRQDGGLRVFRPGWQVGSRAALRPLSDGFLVDPVALGQRPQALLTTVYRSTDCRRRCGAAVENLAHDASFRPVGNNAPSEPATKQLAGDDDATSGAVCSGAAPSPPPPGPGLPSSARP